MSVRTWRFKSSHPHSEAHCHPLCGGRCRRFPCGQRRRRRPCPDVGSHRHPRRPVADRTLAHLGARPGEHHRGAGPGRVADPGRDPGHAGRLPLSARRRRLRARRPDARRRQPHVDPGHRQGLAERALSRPRSHADDSLACERAQLGPAGDRRRQAVGDAPHDRGRGNEDRRDRRRDRRQARLLRPVVVLVPVRIPQGPVVEDDPEGDRAAGVRTELSALRAREGAVRPLDERFVPRDARRRDRRGRPRHHGRPALPLGRRARGLPRQLQGIDDPDARLRARRELRPDRSRDRGGRPGRDERDQPVARRARDLAAAGLRGAGDRRRPRRPASCR